MVTLSRIPQDKESLPSTNGRRRLHPDRNGRAANSAVTCLMVAKTGLLLATGVGSRSANDSMAHKRPKNQWSRKIVHGPSVTVTIDFGVWSGTRVLDFGAQPRGSSDSFAVYLRIDIRTGVRLNTRAMRCYRRSRSASEEQPMDRKRLTELQAPGKRPYTPGISGVEFLRLFSSSGCSSERPVTNACGPLG